MQYLSTFSLAKCTSRNLEYAVKLPPKMLPRFASSHMALALVAFSSPGLAADIPQFTRIAVMGDSITGQTGDSYHYYRSGLWSNFSSRIFQQADLVWNGSLPYFASSGKESLFIEAADLPLVLQSNAEACILMAGTNDYYQQRTPKETAAVLARICRSLEDHHIVPVLCDVLPIGAGTPDKSSWLVQLKGEVDALCAADSSILHIDWFNVLDPDGDGVGDSFYYNDGLHPNANGMTRLGAYATGILKPYIRPRDYLADIVWLTPNPTMQGNGSTPDGWSLHPGSNTAVQSTLIPRPDSLGNWWQIRVDAANPASTLDVYASDSLIGPDAPAFQAGETAELIVEFETDDTVSPNWNLSPLVIAHPSYHVGADSVTGSGSYDMARVSTGILRTSPLIIPADTNAFGCILEVTGTGTFRLGRVGMRRLPPTYSTWINASGVMDQAPDSDPDGDGISNHLEWLLGGNPAVSDAAKLSELLPSDTGAGPFLSFHLAAPGSYDSRLTVQRSSDLLNWSSFEPYNNDSSIGDLVPDPRDATHWLLKGQSGATSAFFRFQADWK